MALRIGELLLKERRITPEQLQEALNHQKASGGKLGSALVSLGFVLIIAIYLYWTGSRRKSGL